MLVSWAEFAQKQKTALKLFLNKLIKIMNVKENSGFSMFEVLISLLVISVGLLGLASMQMVSMKATYNAGSRAQAVHYTYEMIERLRGDPARAVNSMYNSSFGDMPSVNGSTPSGVASAREQVIGWKRELKNALPEAQGQVEVGGDGLATVTVRWNEGRGSQHSEDKSDLSGGLMSFSFSTKLQ